MVSARWSDLSESRYSKLRLSLHPQLQARSLATGGPTFVSSNKTFHGDVDACPTKTFMVDHKDRFWRQYELCFGKRPLEELYDVRSDPSQVNNLAQNPKFAAVKQQLWKQLRERLESTGDPRD